MRKAFRLGQREFKNKDKYIEWQRNVIRVEYVDEKKINKIEKDIHNQGRESVE
ncbi:hypothetical protein [Bacillus bingmayongensis]|uniref:hypothetical protein n=1 Tax=Bacillus bingmayongensis TaxID=1150157 RepID=UPI00037D879A|nr:hypothetical protein [Bacillus bingmayongensis]MBY0595593.1 hypothetical protein [Bacillus bingmayongensis]